MYGIYRNPFWLKFHGSICLLASIYRDARNWKCILYLQDRLLQGRNPIRTFAATARGAKQLCRKPLPKVDCMSTVAATAAEGDKSPTRRPTDRAVEYDRSTWQTWRAAGRKFAVGAKNGNVGDVFVTASELRYFLHYFSALLYQLPTVKDIRVRLENLIVVKVEFGVKDSRIFPKPIEILVIIIRINRAAAQSHVVSAFIVLCIGVGPVVPAGDRAVKTRRFPVHLQAFRFTSLFPGSWTVL